MKKLKTFTLIECLIVITVFCIGILTVFIGLSQTLKNQDYAKSQVRSSFLAREGIELFFNLRDANYHKEMPRNCLFTSINTESLNNKKLDEDANPYCKGYFEPGMVLKVSMGSGGNYIYVETGDLSDLNSFDEAFNKYQIYFHTGSDNGTFNYDYTGSDDEKTNFARYLLITGVVENGDILSTGHILKVESHVLYKQGTSMGDKIMETFIGNYEF